MLGSIGKKTVRTLDLDDRSVRWRHCDRIPYQVRDITVNTDINPCTLSVDSELLVHNEPKHRRSERPAMQTPENSFELW